MKHLAFFTFCFSSLCVFSQLKSRYDVNEAKELIKVNFQFADSSYFEDSLPAPNRFHFVYRSPKLGFDNKWDYWEDENGVGVFSIRGTTGTMASWGANFYSGLIPAKSWIKMSEKDTFYFELSKSPLALVHVGWTTALGALWPSIDSMLFNQIDKGNKEFFITGHSQGGAIAYLLTAKLRIMQENGIIPADIVFKTYCSGAPKPGNLYFAYYYEKMTQQGWAYNTVNALDWVPESPFSIQTVHDFNEINPFENAKKTIKKLPFLARMVVMNMYNKMDKPSRKTQRRFEKYLGSKLGKIMKRTLPGFEPPKLEHSTAYTRCGNFIVLYPEADYYQKFQQDKRQVFTNHSLASYLFLMDKLK